MGGNIFNGYFSVNTDNIVTGFYDLSLPIHSGYTNVLLPTNDASSYPLSDNRYPFTSEGVNFYSTALQAFFGINQNHFNIYNYNNKNIILYTTDMGELTTPLYTIGIQPIAAPQMYTHWITPPTETTTSQVLPSNPLFYHSIVL